MNRLLFVIVKNQTHSVIVDVGVVVFVVAAAAVVVVDLAVVDLVVAAVVVVLKKKIIGKNIHLIYYSFYIYNFVVVYVN